MLCGCQQGISHAVRDARLQKGQVVSSRDDGILSLKWRDKRDVTMLSTYHNDVMVAKSRRSRAAQGGVEDIEKPQVVEDYNLHRGGVDHSKKIVHTCMLFFNDFLYIQCSCLCTLITRAAYLQVINWSFTMASLTGQ